MEKFNMSKRTYYRRLKNLKSRDHISRLTSSSNEITSDVTDENSTNPTESGSNYTAISCMPNTTEPLHLCGPNKYAMDILKLAETHNLTNVCVTDMLRLINEAAVNSTTNHLITSYTDLEKTLEMEKIPVNCNIICQICKKVKFHSLYDRPFQNLICCGWQPTQNDEHFITFDIQSLLQLQLPQLKYVGPPVQDVTQNQIHIENDLSNCKAVQDLRSGCGLTVSDYTLTLNTDGATPFKSSKTSLWPVLAFINEQSAFNRKNGVLMIGLWIGKTKPVFTSFLENIVDQLSELEKTGMRWKTLDNVTILSKITVLCVMCDSIARPLVQLTYQFNGSYGCPYCYYYGATHYFPSFDGTLPQLRTKESHEIDVNNAGLPDGSVSSRGVKGKTPFMKLQQFHPIEGFPPDIMHCVYLGVVKQLTTTWTDEPSKYFCVAKPVDYLDDCLLKIHPPKRVSRLPRHLKFSKLWKAQEWSMWLYYYSPIVLQNVLKDVYYEHWLHLVRAMCIITSTTTLTNALLNECTDSLKTFVSRLEGLYSTKACTFNTHLLLHLPQFLKLYGPLHYLSMTTFESYNHVMNSYITNSQYISSQIAKRYLRTSILKFHNSELAPPNKWVQALSVNGCKFISRVPVRNIKSRDTLIRLLSVNSIELKSTQFFRRVQMKTNRMMYSNLYTAFKKRDCSTSILNDGTPFNCDVFLVDTPNNRAFAFGNRISCSPFKAQLDHISILSERVQCLEPIENFRNAAIKIGHEQFVYIVKFVNSIENCNE